MSPPDVRSFYAALGIDLPGWPRLQAPVRCFAETDARNHADRSPSCSINLASGAWTCHGCGARGGAYDAALTAGHTPRSAIDLMITHGLTEPRAGRVRRSLRTREVPAATPAATEASRPRLEVAGADIESWVKMLDGDGRLVRRLILERAWAPRIMRALEIGFDGERLTIPIRGGRGHLRGILRYDAFGRRDPKMRAVFGTRLGLIPHPASEASDHIILVDGPPDMIAARSAGLPAIAIPGTNAWHPAWARLLASKRVTIVMDCDAPGRRAGDEIAASLSDTAEAVEVVDLWPGRADGYDLTDRILERRHRRACASKGIRTVRGLLAPDPSSRCAGARASEQVIDRLGDREE
jgi:Toprim-like